MINWSVHLILCDGIPMTRISTTPTVEHVLHHNVGCQQAGSPFHNISISSHPFAVTSRHNRLYPIFDDCSSRVEQNNATTHLYPTIPATIRRTWLEEGLRGFYRGLGTNLVRVLPVTCVTFVVYENIAWLLRTTASNREEKRRERLGIEPLGD